MIIVCNSTLEGSKLSGLTLYKPQLGKLPKWFEAVCYWPALQLNYNIEGIRQKSKSSWPSSATAQKAPNISMKLVFARSWHLEQQLSHFLPMNAWRCLLYMVSYLYHHIWAIICESMWKTRIRKCLRVQILQNLVLKQTKNLFKGK